jgi:hypothetical protein
MRNENAVGEGANEAVAGIGKSGRDPFVLWLERRRVWLTALVTRPEL